MNFSSFIAKRYLFARKGEKFINIVSLFAIVGVTLGVAVLLITMSVMTGFESELHKKLVGNAHILVGRYNAYVSDYQELLQRLQTDLGQEKIKRIEVFNEGQVLLNSKSFSRGFILRGLPAETLKKSQAKMPEGGGLPKLYLAPQVSRSLGLIPGQRVKVVSPQTVSSPFGLLPKQIVFEYLGNISINNNIYDQAYAYTDLETSQKFFSNKNEITGLEITLKDPNQAGKLKQQVVETLRSLGLFDFYVQDWTEANKELWEAISLEKKAYFLILLLLIILASFSIITTLIMIVIEKRKDIAIMRTLGAQSKDIRAIFTYMGNTIGISGTLLGLLLGYTSCLLLDRYGFPLPENVFPTNTLPVEIDPVNFLLVGLSAWLICSLATIYPARKASSLEPCDILRYE